jgi:hypothetical protein
MKWMMHVAAMGEMRNTYKILITKPERKRRLRRPTNNFIISNKEKVYECVNWIDADLDSVLLTL